MSTTPTAPNVSSALFGKTRLAVLALLFGRPDERSYVRQIARATKCGLGAVQRETVHLAQAGIVTRIAAGNEVYLQVNRGCPIYEELRALIAKMAGAPAVVRAALTSLSSRIKVAFIFGSLAAGSGRDNSDVDVFVIGDVTFSAVVEALFGAQQQLGREVNPVVFDPIDFRARAESGQHFVASVLAGPKTYVIGDKHDLEELAGQRLAD